MSHLVFMDAIRTKQIKPRIKSSSTLFHFHVSLCFQALLIAVLLSSLVASPDVSEKCETIKMPGFEAGG